MARITVEDCLQSVDNLFDLVLLASKRARQLANGAEARVDWQNDKPTVVALREIAEETVNLAGLMESLVKGLQRQVEVDEPEEEILEVMADEQALAQAMMAGAAQAAEAADEDVTEIPDAELGDDAGEDRA